MSQPESKDNKKKKAKSLKFTHSELEALKIISRVDPNIPRSILKACTYQFDNGALTSRVIACTRAVGNLNAMLVQLLLAGSRSRSRSRRVLK